MVFNKISASEPAEQREEKILKKIFTCSEIEEENNNKAMKSTPTSQKNLQHDDPAVLFSRKLTRYDTAELRKMQNLFLSQRKPPCCFNERILKLDILKSENGMNNRQISVDDRVKMLQDNIRTLALQNWNSTIYQNYKSYHYALLNPNYNYMGSIPLHQPNSQQQQQEPESPNQTLQDASAASNTRRRVSFDIDQQQAALDKILTYDRKTVFFDTLTTTTTMRPPKMNNNNNSLQQQTKRNNNSFSRPQRNSFDNIQKKNPAGNYSTCNDKYVSSSFASPGYFSNTNDLSYKVTQKKSEISADSPKVVFETKQDAQAKDNTGDNEKQISAENEPEWFSFPATRQDFVDLHGFTEEDEVALKSTTSAKASSDQVQKGNGKNKYQSPRFDNGYNPNFHNQRQQQHNYSHFHQSSDDEYFYNHARPHGPFFSNNRPNNNNNSHNRLNNSHNQYYQSAINNQRFRNPLHQSKSPSPKTPTIPPAANFCAKTFIAPAPAAIHQNHNFQPINPFYEAWKCGSANMMNQKNINFTHLMQQSIARPAPPSMKLMSDVEQGIIQNSQNVRAPVISSTGNIEQFFQNFSDLKGHNKLANNLAEPSQQHQHRQETVFPPTREQLQQHTSEILRNAILRNREQQYHDEKNNQK